MQVNGMIASNLQSLGLLVLRVSVAAMMMTHGVNKLQNFSAMSGEFPDPIGLGSTVALGLVVFAEFFCSILLALGLATRLATIPLIVTMLVAILVAHKADPFSGKEMACLYLAIYVTLLATGPGQFALDRFFRFRKKLS